MMRYALILALIAAPAAATEVIRLSDAQRDAVITAAANGPEKAPVLTPVQTPRPSVLDRPLYPEFFAADGPPINDRKVHGEMTMFAGSGGTFGISGTAIVPVGETGMAAVSVTQGRSRFGNISGFGFGFTSGDARRSFNADISNPGLFGPGISAFDPGFPPRGRR
ncbi:hypothetical protein CAP39_12285 [Sphingomonas sp. IBVSS1]|nr:hypothetical protein CAP39_12285 [Sphingomonas sp. IBVSS1]